MATRTGWPFLLNERPARARPATPPALERVASSCPLEDGPAALEDGPAALDDVSSRIGGQRSTTSARAGPSSFRCAAESTASRPAVVRRRVELRSRLPACRDALQAEQGSARRDARHARTGLDLHDHDPRRSVVPRCPKGSGELISSPASSREQPRNIESCGPRGPQDPVLGKTPPLRAGDVPETARRERDIFGKLPARERR